MSYPTSRPRRLRATAQMRHMVAETTLSPADFVYPMFVVDEPNVHREIPSMPGCFHNSIEHLTTEAREVAELGIGAVILFGIPKEKDIMGCSGYAPEGIVPRAIRALKKDLPQLQVWADVCLCEYTSHGHCGILKNGDVDNDTTLPLLAQTAHVYTAAGADVIAPSDMMDGRIAAIRKKLDDNGYHSTPIVSYAAKYCSGYYGPFREAADSAPQSGGREGYQMDPANAREAMREMQLDIDEGADVVMVKPALAYLDIVRMARDRFDTPIAAYNVSGEYAMIKAAAANGWIDEQRVMHETLLSMKRAGADIILTYFAKDAATLLRGESR